MQAYAALLLTCLVAHSPPHVRELGEALPAGGLVLLCMVVDKFLSFSKHVGMVSAHSQRSMLEQLAVLKRAVVDAEEAKKR